MRPFILAFIGVFIFVFAYDWVLHGMILKDMYGATMELWRPEAEMASYFKWILVGQALSSFAITMLVARAAFGPKCGLGIGALVGLVLVAGNLIGYAVQPIPSNLALAWSLSAMVQGALAGGIAGFLYFKFGGKSCCHQSKNDVSGQL